MTISGEKNNQLINQLCTRYNRGKKITGKKEVIILYSSWTVFQILFRGRSQQLNKPPTLQLALQGNTKKWKMM